MRSHTAVPYIVLLSALAVYIKPTTCTNVLSMTATRYERNIALPGIGETGQSRLCQSQVTVVGAGGLGCPALAYLAAAGVGMIRVIDADSVEESNFNRQVLHPSHRVGQPKAQSAARTLRALNPLITVQAHPVKLDATNCSHLLGGADVILDACDNFPTKYLLADYARQRQANLIWGTIVGMHAQIGAYLPTHDPNQGLTLRDLFPVTPSESVATGNGVLGAACGVAGSLMASQAIGVLSGGWFPRQPRLTLLDVANLSVRSLYLKPHGSA